MTLEQHLKRFTQDQRFTPEFFDLSKSIDRKRLAAYFDQNLIVEVNDSYTDQLEELFQIDNPRLVHAQAYETSLAEFLEEIESRAPLYQQGKWVYFPWNRKLIHILDEPFFQKVRFSRNRNYISRDEQANFYHSSIGIAGLSVGNSIATTIVMLGGAKHIRLADFDELSLSNCNRIRTSIENLGIPKIIITARQIYELNPYANVQIFPEGITEENIEAFLSSSPPLDIVIDELDNLAMKYLLRMKAKENRIPVLMGTDNGDDCIIDLERYDLDPTREIFHGRLNGVEFNDLKNLTKAQIGKIAGRLIGIENISSRMMESLPEIGTSLISWPQLGSAALMNGAALAYCARRILNKQPIADGRCFLSVEKELLPAKSYDAELQKRKKLASQLM